MKKTFCDRCKTEIYGGGGKVSQSMVTSEPGKPTLMYDLCNTCYNKLKVFLKNE